jgi:hypothetical protein
MADPTPTPTPDSAAPEVFAFAEVYACMCEASGQPLGPERSKPPALLDAMRRIVDDGTGPRTAGDVYRLAATVEYAYYLRHYDWMVDPRYRAPALSAADLEAADADLVAAYPETGPRPDTLTMPEHLLPLGSCGPGVYVFPRPAEPAPGVEPHPTVREDPAS